MKVAAASAAATVISETWRELGLDDSAGHTHDPQVAAAVVRQLVEHGARLPLPARGRTRERFDALATIGELDLTVGRLIEAHADALAILAELDAALLPSPRTDVWAVWASEASPARVSAHLTSSGWHIDGRKAWCSGAGSSTQALVTAASSDGPRLFAVDLTQPGVVPVDDPWPAAALSGTDTRSVDFVDATAVAVGGPGDYLTRAGFWHGSVGVAAVWFGGTVAVSRALLRAGRHRSLGDLDLSHLGAIGASLTAARTTLAIAADEFDADPHDSAGRAAVTARSTRAVVEASAIQVMDRLGRALGPGPLALDGEHARRIADLQLYLRQSHADRDLADLGERLVQRGELW